MGITTAMCSSFKRELLGGLHDLDTDTIKLALIKPSNSGTYGAATTNYSDIGSDESSGTNYTSGGQALGSPSITLDGTTAMVDFANEVFENVSTSADGCIIYNTASADGSTAGAAICVIDFGGTVTAVAGDLTIEFPAVGASTTIIRIA